MKAVLEPGYENVPSIAVYRKNIWCRIGLHKWMTKYSLVFPDHISRNIKCLNCGYSKYKKIRL
jgi:hypothetical protein